MGAALRRNHRIVERQVENHIWGLYDLDTGGYKFIDKVSLSMVRSFESYSSREELIRACNETFPDEKTRASLDFPRRVDELIEFGVFKPEEKNVVTDVLLVEPPYVFSGSKVGGTVAPRGLCYLSKALTSKGLEPARILDMRSTTYLFRDDRAEMISYFTRYARTCNPSVVGISSISATIDNALLVARLAKTLFPDSYLVLGGPHASYTWQEILDKHSYVDAVVRGEGEVSFPLLVDRVNATSGKRRDFADIPGIAWRDGNGKAVTSGWSERIQDLDVLGWPDVFADVINVEDYQDTQSLHFISSRGCPFNCSFCSTASFGARTLRYRSIESVIEEINYYWEEHDLTDFCFDDDIFTVNKKRTLALCKAIADAPFNVPWGCSTRLDCIDEEIMDGLRNAGCTRLFFGVESGDENVQLRFGKGRHLLNGFRKKIQALLDRGMKARLNFILGLPGENMDSIRAIVDLIGEFPEIPCSFSFLTIFPGTPLADQLDELGIELVGEDGQGMYSFTAPTMGSPSMSADEQVDALMYLQWERRKRRYEAHRRRAEMAALPSPSDAPPRSEESGSTSVAHHAVA